MAEWTAADQAFSDFVDEIACEISEDSDIVHMVLGAIEERGLFSRSEAIALMIAADSKEVSTNAARRPRDHQRSPLGCLRGQPIRRWHVDRGLIQRPNDPRASDALDADARRPNRSGRAAVMTDIAELSRRLLQWAITDAIDIPADVRRDLERASAYIASAAAAIEALTKERDALASYAAARLGDGTTADALIGYIQHQLETTRVRG